MDIYSIINDNMLTPEQKAELPIQSQHAELKDFSELYDVIQSSSPSDYIEYNRDTAKTISTYLKTNLGIDFDRMFQKIPNDIFIADSIPIKDMVFRCHIYSDNYEELMHIDYIRVIYKDGKLFAIVQAYNSRDRCWCNCICLTTDVIDEFVQINPSLFYIEELDDYYKCSLNTQHSFKAASYHMANYILAVWYTIQIMMLNPALKEHLFVRSCKDKSTGKSVIFGDPKNSKTKKRKALYVKYKKMNPVVMHSDIIRKRHTLCWYVIGHWRHYNNGKKIFVQGYWKGPLRELEKNLDTGRERKIQV